jgi:pimeloyl-ACP methyl ester carboxylesterase
MRASPLLLLLGSFLVGCAQRELVNPSFDVSSDAARAQLDRMKLQPPDQRPALQRPLVILDGFGSIGFYPWRLAGQIEDRARGTFVTVSYPLALNFDACRRHVVDVLDRELGVANDRETVEVDVIGMSMGGLVAVYSAIDDPARGKRLKVRNLYTISSPLNGAELARRLGSLSLVPLHRDLRPGSALFEQIAKAKLDFSVVSYTRLDDDIVGARFASLPGRGVYWLPNLPLEHAHFAVMNDPRILADILHRLRGEPALAMAEPAPLPAAAR